MITFSVAGIPTPFSAVHLYSLASCLLKLINGMVTFLLSESLVHVMLGGGLPFTEQFKVTLPPSITVLPVIFMILDGTESKHRRGGELSSNKKSIFPRYVHGDVLYTLSITLFNVNLTCTGINAATSSHSF